MALRMKFFLGLLAYFSNKSPILDSLLTLKIDCINTNFSIVYLLISIKVQPNSKLCATRILSLPPRLVRLLTEIIHQDYIFTEFR